MDKHQPVDWSILHSVEEMQRLSNFGHRVEGILLLLVALIAFGEATRVIRFKLLWPSFIVIAGIFLIGFLLLHHGLDQFKLVWNLILQDPQQRQHLVMAVLLVVAGVSEILFRKKAIRVLQFVWPLVIATIGIMFLVHEQHGSSEAVKWAQRIHEYLGILMIVVAVFILLNLLQGEKYEWLKFSWPVLLMITSIFLFIYQEPEGAYEQKKDSKHINH